MSTPITQFKEYEQSALHLTSAEQDALVPTKSDERKRGLEDEEKSNKKQRT